MMKITEPQAAALRKLRDVPFLWPFQWVNDLTTHEVDALEARGLLEDHWHTDGDLEQKQGWRITLAGIRALEEHDSTDELAMLIAHEYSRISEHGVEEGIMERAVRNVLAKEDPVYRVKALEWDGEFARASSDTTYHVAPSRNETPSGFEVRILHTKYVGWYLTEAEARAACQAHLEARLSECLKRVE